MKYIQIASIKKRILSALIDAVIIASLFCLFYFLVFTKAVASVQNYQHLNDVIYQERIASGLYQEKDGKAVSLLEINPKAGETDLKQSVENFYQVYLFSKKETYTAYWYDVHVLYLDDIDKKYEKEELTKPETTLFLWVDNLDSAKRAKKKFPDNQEAYDSFYRANYASATTILVLTEQVMNAVKTITWGNIRAALYSSLVATFIPCFIIPISLKNGKTVGKLITKLAILTDDGYEYKKHKHIFRYLAFYIVEVFGGVATIGLTLILTASLVLFTKKKRALHDYIAFSVVVDEVHSVFYKEREEEMIYQNKSLEKLPR